MLIDLRECAKTSQEQAVQVELRTRLPNRVVSPCSLGCSYSVRAKDNYFLMNLEVYGDVTIECQRCLKQFLYPYKNKTSLAVCDTEACAEKLMYNYDCIITKNFSVNLIELITDELHLYTPEYHPDGVECDKEVSKFISNT